MRLNAHVLFTFAVLQKNSGQLISRYTCVDCVDTEENCLEKWDNICFHAQFNHDNNDMEECLVVLATNYPFTECNTCSPCQLENGSWGMDFDCFDGAVSTNGACFDDLRVGLHPFDGKLATAASNNDNDDRPIFVVATVGFVLVLLLMNMICFVRCYMRQRKRQEDLTDPTRPGIFKTNGDTDMDETTGETESAPYPVEGSDHSIQ